MELVLCRVWAWLEFRCHSTRASFRWPPAQPADKEADLTLLALHTKQSIVFLSWWLGVSLVFVCDLRVLSKVVPVPCHDNHLHGARSMRVVPESRHVIACWG